MRANVRIGDERSRGGVRGAAEFAHEQQHRRRGEQTGDDADGEQPAVADRHDQWSGQQRAGDRAERIHGSFDAKGTPELIGFDRSGEQAVAGWRLAAARGP